MHTNISGLWIGVFEYLLVGAILLFYVVKIKKAPLSSLGLQKIRFGDFPRGFILGSCMFIAQQIPLLILGIDYSALAIAPDPVFILIMTLYCFFCVGFMEELIFRGFILQKTLFVCHSKIISILVNILLFYLAHWFSSRQFIFGEFYNIAVNVILLSVYFFQSKRKSLIPLIIAHGFYDMLTSVLLPVFIYMLK